MALKEQLAADLKDAMKARDERRVSAIRMMRAAIENYEIARTDRKNPQYGKPIAEGDLIGVLQRLQALAPSVCRLETTIPGDGQYGTAFRIASDLLLTNWHVVNFGSPSSSHSWGTIYWARRMTRVASTR